MNQTSVLRRAGLAAPLVIGLLQIPTAAQDRLKTMPGYQQYLKMTQEIPSAVKLGSLAVTWNPDGRSFDYSHDGKRYRYDVATRAATEIGVAEAPAGRGGRGGGRGAASGAPERGRQFDSADSPDGKRKAFYRERNLWLSDGDGGEVAITTDGSEANRIKYGTASWVYGEELGQRTAMWWSPDNRRLAFRRQSNSVGKSFVVRLSMDHPISTEGLRPIDEPTATGRPCGWSSDSRIVYLLLDTDGSRCLWAQRIDSSGAPVGNPVIVRHFHSTQGISTSFGDAITSDGFLYEAAEESANVWKLTPARQP